MQLFSLRNIYFDNWDIIELIYTETLQHVNFWIWNDIFYFPSLFIKRLILQIYCQNIKEKIKSSDFANEIILFFMLNFCREFENNYVLIWGLKFYHKVAMTLL